MVKRKAQDKPQKVFEDESSSDDSDEEMLDVEFEFFDPDPKIDFQGLKNLLRQLLDVDAQQLDLSALSDLLLTQNLLGSTVKTDGKESDPWAFLSVLNIQEHRDKPVIQQLVRYLLNQAGKTPSLEKVKDVLSVDSSAQVGLLLSERAFGVPTELIPPMYKMLSEEIQWAVEEREPYTFTHYLVISKNYVEIESTLDQEDTQAKKKLKKSANGTADIFYFHPEDEVIQRHATAYGNYSFDNEESEGQSDARRTFQETGVKPQGSLILLEAEEYQGLVRDLEKYVQS